MRYVERVFERVENNVGDILSIFQSLETLEVTQSLRKWLK